MVYHATMTRAVDPELTALVAQVREAQQGARDLAGALRADQLLWRPESARWSIGECLNHLTVTVGRYLPMLDAAIEHGRARGRTGTGPFRYGWLSRRFVAMLEPPPKRRFKAPAPFLPAADLDAARVLPEFLARHDELIDRIERAQGLDLVRVTVRSPASALLRLNLGKRFELMCAHARRHLWQARQVVAESSFPR